METGPGTGCPLLKGFKRLVDVALGDSDALGCGRMV